MPLKNIKIDKLTLKEKGYLFGLLTGDGYLHKDKNRHYKINFYLNPKKDLDIAELTIHLLRKIDAHPYTMNHKGCLIIRINSKKLFNFFKNKSFLKKMKENSDFILGFISGFIDSDGYVIKGDIVITNKDKDILKETKFFCNRLNITSKIWKQSFSNKETDVFIWRLRISTKFKYEKHISQKICRIYGGGNL